MKTEKFSQDEIKRILDDEIRFHRRNQLKTANVFFANECAVSIRALQHLRVILFQEQLQL